MPILTFQGGLAALLTPAPSLPDFGFALVMESGLPLKLENGQTFMREAAPLPAPVIAPGQVFVVPETATVNTVVGSVVASPQPVSWAITAGNVGGAFAINAAGVLRVAAPLDYDVLQGYTLQITGTNSGGTSVPTAVGITISQAASALLIDTLSAGTTVKAAYGFRKLRSAYAGAAVKIRRGSDNQELDIGFDASGHLDNAALATHIGASRGFVRTWYDQSGLAHHLEQTTAADQPWITDTGGTRLTLPGGSASRTTMRLDSTATTGLTCAALVLGASNDKLGMVAALSVPAWTTADMLIFTTDSTTLFYTVAGGTAPLSVWAPTPVVYVGRNSMSDYSYGSGLSVDTGYSLSVIFNGTNVQGWVNGSSTASQAVTGDMIASPFVALGYHNSINATDLHISELIISTVMATADRTLIDDSQNTYYGY
jgi:hypothetical protein